MSMAYPLVVKYDDYHNHWYVKNSDQPKAMQTFDTKEKAVDYAKKVAKDKSRKEKVSVFKKNGRFQEDFVYGKSIKEKVDR